MPNQRVRVGTHGHGAILYTWFVYLLCPVVIRCGKTQEYVGRVVEPIIHLLSISVPLALGIWAWLSDALNPLDQVGGVCFIYEYPSECDRSNESDTSIDCERGHNYSTIALIAGTGTVVPVWIGLVIAMTAVVLHIWKLELVYSRRRLNPQTARLRQTCIQAILYISAFFVTYIFVPIDQFSLRFDERPRFVFALLLKLFLPLQGFFNSAIYIRPRYVLLRAQQRGRVPAFVLIRQIVMGSSNADTDNDYNGRGDQSAGFAPELDGSILDSSSEDQQLEDEGNHSDSDEGMFPQFLVRLKGCSKSSIDKERVGGAAAVAASESSFQADKTEVLP